MIIILVIVILLAAFLFYFLLIEGKWPQKSDFHIPFEIVKKMGDSEQEELPEQINRLTIATGKLPGWGVSAGDFTARARKIEFPCFQIVYPSKTVILEVPFNRYLFDKFSFKNQYFKDNYNKMQKAMLEAEMIIPTHEHWDHLGGIAQSKNIDQIIKKVILTPEQIHGPTISDSEFPEGILDKIIPYPYANLSSPSPGIVLIKAPGHSTGHQFIYVRLKNGKEYLFTGDVFWSNRNLETKKNRPLIASKKRLENRKMIAHQMKYLYDNFYQNKNQEIIQVSTHDPKQHKKYLEKGLLHNGLQLK